jgi:ElaB/YqjD/DUF883 family membrane-anchored ribosome-binding protein
LSKNSEKTPLIDNLQEKVEDARAVAEQSRARVESFVRKRPIESAGMFFLAGLLFGLVIGIVASRSD